MNAERVKELMDQAWTLVSDEERTNGELYEADRQRERRDQVFAQLVWEEAHQAGYDEGVEEGWEQARHAWR
jgi:hypothetical protein